MIRRSVENNALKYTLWFLLSRFILKFFDLKTFGDIETTIHLFTKSFLDSSLEDFIILFSVIMVLFFTFKPRFVFLEVIILLIDSIQSESIEKCSKNPSIRPCPLPLDNLKYPPIAFRADGALSLDGDIDGNEFLLSCPGSKFKSFGVSTISVSCPGETGLLKYVSNGSSLSLSTCTKKPQETVINSETRCGPSNSKGSIVTVGWTVTSKFTPQYSVCHDIEEEKTYFVSHIIKGSSSLFGNFKGDDSRPSYFKEGSDFFKLSSASSVYKLKNQMITIRKLYGLESAYYSKKDSFYLARGHLAPDADFDLIHNSLADATYHYINVAPQWQSFNNGNWKALEIGLRSFAGKNSIDLQIYTGTLGVLTLKDTNGNPVELYLAENSKIPAPSIFWKLIHYGPKNEALAFIGLNNPFLEKSDIEPICEDICTKSGWDSMLDNRISIKRGYIYCCSYEEFKKAIHWAPQLKNPQVLKYADITKEKIPDCPEKESEEDLNTWQNILLLLICAILMIISAILTCFKKLWLGFKKLSTDIVV